MDAVTETPAWRKLHDAWWDEQRQPQPGDVEAAWDALYEVLPVSWMTSRLSYEPASRLWCANAVRGTKVAGPPVVTADGPTESAAIVELAPCIVDVQDGRIPR